MYKQFFILFLLMSVVSAAHSDSFAEKESLARLANEILALEPLIREAERRSEIDNHRKRKRRRDPTLRVMPQIGRLPPTAKPSQVTL